MKPADLLNCQADLARRLDERNLPTVIATRILGRADRLDALLASDEPLPTLLRGVLDAAPDAAREANVYDVVKPMISLTRWAADSYDAAATFKDVRPPATAGLARLDGGVPFCGQGDSEFIADWLLWFEIESTDEGGDTPAWMLFFFNDAIDNADGRRRYLAEDPEMASNLHRLQGRWALTRFNICGPETHLGPASVLLPPSDYDVSRAPEQATNLLRFTYALWSLMREPVVATPTTRPDRATSKRMQRARMRDEVTVVTLRHLVEASDPRGEVEWQHHWVVRGHYRMQACGEGRRDRRLVYIAPHVKGNQDGPLLETHRVHRLVR